MDAIDMLRSARAGYKEQHHHDYSPKWVTVSNGIADRCKDDPEFAARLSSLMVSDIPPLIRWMADSHGSRYYRGYRPNGLTKSDYTEIAPRMVEDYIRFSLKETAHG